MKCNLVFVGIHKNEYENTHGDTQMHILGSFKKPHRKMELKDVYFAHVFETSFNSFLHSFLKNPHLIGISVCAPTRTLQLSSVVSKFRINLCF